MILLRSLCETREVIEQTRVRQAELELRFVIRTRLDEGLRTREVRLRMTRLAALHVSRRQGMIGLTSRRRRTILMYTASLSSSVTILRSVPVRIVELTAHHLLGECSSAPWPLHTSPPPSAESG